MEEPAAIINQQGIRPPLAAMIRYTNDPPIKLLGLTSRIQTCIKSHMWVNLLKQQITTAIYKQLHRHINKSKGQHHSARPS